jgi:glutamate dehydrogenase (NAD(P)+)
MIGAGIELIASGANIPFADEVNFFGPVYEYADNNISVIPDFVANIGIARVFNYLIQNDVEVSEEAIFNDVSDTVRTILSDVFREYPGSTTQISKNIIENAISQLV